MVNFHDLNLPTPLVDALDKLGLTTPTNIQRDAIPEALQGRDILGSARTGTGKTLAFSLPMLAHLIENPTQTALILVPTRELAQQVLQTVRQLLTPACAMKTALIIGGEGYPKQLAQLRAQPRIIVGTPGRMIDHLKRGTLAPQRIGFLILDEMDRMFDMGFSIQIEQIIEKLPAQRQTLMFTATLPPKIERVARKYLENPLSVFVEQEVMISEKLVMETRNVQESEKYPALVEVLDAREGSILVFVKTKFDADKIADRLRKMNHSASAIHGGLRQHKREKLMSDFRQGRYRIMIATDVAARGLDVPHIQHVINYDLPQCPEDYVHRIGRTARAGAEGAALNFVSNQDRGKWRAIQHIMNPNEAAEERREFKRSGPPARRDKPFKKRAPFKEGPYARDTRDTKNTRGAPYKKAASQKRMPRTGGARTF